MITLAKKAVGYRENTKFQLIRAINLLRKYFIRLGELMVQECILPDKELVFHLTVNEIVCILQKPNPVLLSK